MFFGLSFTAILIAALVVAAVAMAAADWIRPPYGSILRNFSLAVGLIGIAQVLRMLLVVLANQ